MKPQKKSMNQPSTLKYPMKEKMARKAQTASPTSLLMGVGAFFAV